jgi:large subunit ribosomal protein L21
MSKFAVIKTGGKQYKVEVGTVLSVEKLDVNAGDKVKFDEVLLISDKDVKLGNPVIEGASVEAVVIDLVKGEKINGFKYKAKARYRKSYGHRQKYTKVEIKTIK